MMTDELMNQIMEDRRMTDKVILQIMVEVNKTVGENAADIQNMKETLDQIMTQVLKTNGRVTVIEKVDEKRKGYLAGIIAVLTVVGYVFWESIKLFLK